MTDKALCVLIVENDALIALDVASTLEEFGMEVMGPFHDVESAEETISSHVPDAALLDVKLDDGGTTESLAVRLRDLGCPFAFLTGYSPQGSELLQKFPDIVCLGKPFQVNEVIDWLESQGLMSAK